MRILFICYTYMQMITSLQISRKLFQGVPADIVISDNSVGAGEVCENLRGTKVFKNVDYVRAKHLLVPETLHNKIEDTRIRLFGTSPEIRSMNLHPDAYDFIFFYNMYNILAQYLYDQSVKRGKNPRLCRFEEGIISCSRFGESVDAGIRWKIIMELRKRFKKDRTCMIPERYYCYYPQLIEDKHLNCFEIPPLDRNDSALVSCLNRAFSYDPAQDSYPQKYIFFGSTKDVDAQPVGETELVLRIAGLVGKENLLVKMHTRDGRTVYEDYGIRTSRNSAVPWEVIQLNHDFSAHVFLTVSSSCVLSASAMLGDDIPTFYLYELLQDPGRAKQYADVRSIEPTLDSLQGTGLLTCVKIARHMNDILSV